MAKSQRIAFGGAAALLAGYLIRGELHAAIANFRDVREWDFLCFWLWAKIGANGLNFYDPQVAASVAQGLDVTAEFRRLIVDVGFWYPPPTMLLFAPLGLLSMRLALGWWYAVLGLSLVISAVLLNRLVGNRAGAATIAMLAMLVLALPTSHMTLWLMQTNFIVLAAVAALWLERDRPRAGLWLALGVLVKPYLAILGIFLILHRNWKAIGLGLLAWSALCLATAAAFGWGPIWSYLTDNPMARLPIDVHSEPINQSLFATLLRMTDNELRARSFQANVWFLSLAVAILVSTTVLAWRSRRAAPEYSFSLILTAGLLLYPSTLAHYGLLLVVPLLLLWRRQQSGTAEWFVLAFAACVQFLTGVALGSYAFWAMAAVWLVFAGLAAWSPAPARLSVPHGLRLGGV